MFKNITLFIALSSFTNLAHAQTSSEIFLDCDSTRTYSIPEQKRFDEKLSFKIDQEKSIIYQFDFDKGIYENTCVKGDGKSKFSEMVGSCLITEEFISFIYTANFIFFHESQSLRIFRGSGRLRGNLSTYSGPYQVGEWDPAKKPTVQYDIDGSCVRGRDMRTAKKVF
jgi:hypothetical protein